VARAVAYALAKNPANAKRIDIVAGELAGLTANRVKSVRRARLYPEELETARSEMRLGGANGTQTRSFGEAFEFCQEAGAIRQPANVQTHTVQSVPAPPDPVDVKAVEFSSFVDTLTRLMETTKSQQHKTLVERFVLGDSHGAKTAQWARASRKGGEAQDAESATGSTG